MAVPVITSLSTYSGAVGDTVVITGTDLGSISSVTFYNNKAATVTANTATSITVTVPALATSGVVTATNGDGSDTSEKFFVHGALPTEYSSFTGGAFPAIADGTPFGNTLATRADAWTTLTPTQVEFNREVEFIKTNPPVDDAPTF